MTTAITSFDAWLANARPGASTTYYIGNLAFARGVALVSSPVPTDEPDELRNASAAWAAAHAGLVFLTQRAIGPRDYFGRHAAFHYIATRRSRL